MLLSSRRAPLDKLRFVRNRVIHYHTSNGPSRSILHSQEADGYVGHRNIYSKAAHHTAAKAEVLPGEGSPGSSAGQLIGALHGSGWHGEQEHESASGPGSRSAYPMFPCCMYHSESRHLSGQTLKLQCSQQGPSSE